MAVARLQADSCNISSLPSELLCSIALWLPARDVLALSTALRLSRPTCVTALVLTEDYTWQQLFVRDFGEREFERMLAAAASETPPSLSVRSGYMRSARYALVQAHHVRGARHCDAETWDSYNACAIVVHASLATLHAVGVWMDWTQAHRLCATLSAAELETLPEASLTLPEACSFCPLPLHLCALLFNRDHGAFGVLVRRFQVLAPFSSMWRGVSEAIALRMAFVRRYNSANASFESFCTFESGWQLDASTLVSASRSATLLVNYVLPVLRRVRACDDAQHATLCTRVIDRLLSSAQDYRGVQRARTSTLELIKHLWDTVPYLEPLDVIATLYEFGSDQTQRCDPQRLLQFIEDVIGAALDASSSSRSLWAPLVTPPMCTANGTAAAATIESSVPPFDARLLKLVYNAGCTQRYAFSRAARLRWARRMFNALLDVERNNGVRLCPTTKASCPEWDTAIPMQRHVHSYIMDFLDSTTAGIDGAGAAPFIETLAAHHARLCGLPQTCCWSAELFGTYLRQQRGVEAYIDAAVGGRWPQLAEDRMLTKMLYDLRPTVIELGTVRVCTLLRTLLEGSSGVERKGYWWLRGTLQRVLDYGDNDTAAATAAVFDLIDLLFEHPSMADKIGNSAHCTFDCVPLCALEARWRHVCADAAGRQRFATAARRLAGNTEHVHSALFGDRCRLGVALASMRLRGASELAEELSSTVDKTTQRWRDWRESLSNK
jgi:hypothetical protein